MRILPTPLRNLSSTPRQSSEIGMPLVIQCGQDVAVKVGSMKNRNPNHIPFRLECPGPLRNEERAGRAAKQTEELPAIWRRNAHDPNFDRNPNEDNVFADETRRDR